MDLLTERLGDIQHRLSRLRCPECGAMVIVDYGLLCPACGRLFSDATTGMIDLTRAAGSKTKETIAAFWGDIYRQWYAADDVTRTTEALQHELTLLEDLFQQRDHLAVLEMDLPHLAGKEVLEIGSGGGGHSALFVTYGAHVTAIDITPERVLSTGRKFDLLRPVAPGSGLALRADAETLPFDDNAFDIIYSNGVLHHTANTDCAIDEVWRVLRPGGQAVIMLYARSSIYYWLKLLPIGLLRREALRLPEAEWVGRITEGIPHYQGERNPYTRVYNRRQLLNLFARFERVSLRKNGFTLNQLPIPGLHTGRDRLLRALGHTAHNGGRIVYGSPFIPDTKLERAIGRQLGFGWNIKATKPLNSKAANRDRI